MSLKGLSQPSLFCDLSSEIQPSLAHELMDFSRRRSRALETVWNQEAFEEGKVGLEESTFYPYPRYERTKCF